MRRRAFLALLAVAPVSIAVGQTGKARRIGWLSSGTRANKAALASVFVQGLQALGYVVGRDIVIHQRDADGRIERLPAMAADLVQLGVEVIVTTEGVPATRAALDVTRSVPIVMTEAGDPVRSGLVAGLARPGGNVTGLAVGGDLPAGRLQILKQLSPTTSRVAVPCNADFPGTLAWIESAQTAARALGLAILPVQARSPEELERAFAAAVASGADALLTLADPFTSNRQAQILALAARHRLPAIHVLREFVEAGGLASYGVDLAVLYRRAADYVDKLLRGAKPEDLPVEQPTNFQLVVNLKAAKALDLTIPQALLLRADKVIE
jgi:putative tryptophan/tyrosine transport system substrate-binding protein